jgi:hypothetical protein
VSRRALARLFGRDPATTKFNARKGRTIIYPFMKKFIVPSKIKTSLLLAAALALLGQLDSAQAYSTAPTWSPMTMLKVWFDTNSSQLSIQSQNPTNPIVLVFNTLATGKADTTNATPANFDPTKPWSVLNGTVFSRRLGWWTTNSTLLAANVTNTYGTGAGIWIESLSKSPGLKTYQAIGTFGVNSLGTTNLDGTPAIDPAANGYAGIFGTAGSSTKWKWDYQMDHNANAVSLGDVTVANQIFTNTYKIYIGDSTGAELPAAVGASTTTTWTWQGPATLVAPSPGLQSKVVLSWSGTATNYVAESADSLSSTTWTAVTNTPGVIDGKTVILIDPAGSQRYFRLHLVQ